MNERKAWYIFKHFTYMYYAELIFLKLEEKKYFIVIELFAMYGCASLNPCTQEGKSRASRVQVFLGYTGSLKPD